MEEKGPNFTGSKDQKPQKHSPKKQTALTMSGLFELVYSGNINALQKVVVDEYPVDDDFYTDEEEKLKDLGAKNSMQPDAVAKFIGQKRYPKFGIDSIDQLIRVSWAGFRLDETGIAHLAKDKAMLDFLLLLCKQAGNTFLGYRDRKGNTALHTQCCQSVDDKLLHYLIDDLAGSGDIKSDIATLKNDQGYTPLDLACEQGLVEVASVLLNSEAYMALEQELANKQQRKVPLLHRLCAFESHNHLELAELLIRDRTKKKQIIYEKDNEGNTPLHVAARAGKDKMIAWLLRQGADPMLANGRGDIPMHDACRHGHKIAANALYPSYKRCMMRSNNAGYTPLDLACIEGHADVVSELFKNSIPKADNKMANNKVETGQRNLLKHKMKEKKSPMQLAAIHGRVEVVEVILTSLIGQNSLLYDPEKTPLEIAYDELIACDDAERKTALDRVAISFLQHETSRNAVERCLMKYEQNKIRGMLKRYHNEKWCGQDDAAAFFRMALDKLQKKIDQIAIKDNEYESGSTDSEKSGDRTPPLLLAEEPRIYVPSRKYHRGLDRTIAALNKDFDKLDFDRQLDRIIVAYKMQGMIEFIKRDDKDKDEKKNYINRQFASMKPLYHSEMVRDAVKLFCFILLGIVVGVAIGLSAGAATAAFAVSSTALYTTLSALGGGAVGATSYFGLFKTHKCCRNMSKQAVREVRRQPINI